MRTYKAQLSVEFLLSTSIYALFIITILFFMKNTPPLFVDEELSYVSKSISYSSISGAVSSFDEEYDVIVIDNVFYIKKNGNLERMSIVRGEEKNYG